MYVCGITPYDSAHLGHIFTFMTYDLLQRRLEDMGHTVRMVRNVTDVDEPIYRKAAELNIDYRKLASAEVASFRSVLERLNFRPLYAEPHASEYIDQMAGAVKQLIDKKYGYYVGKDVYFDTSKCHEYGLFSGFNHKLLIALLKERGGDPDLKEKHSPLDFLLWRHIDDPADTAQWNTVLGSGRPGWHIECTIMSSDLLGPAFDIHGGGTDLIFPHHESEIAQGMALNGVKPAELWVHVSPLLMAGEKMSKSLGNMVFAKDLLGDYDAATIRLALMHYHHRIGGEWQPELLSRAEQLIHHVRKAAQQCSDTAANNLLDEVREALDDDINTYEIIRAFHRFAASGTDTAHSAGKPNPTALQTLSLLGLD